MYESKFLDSVKGDTMKEYVAGFMFGGPYLVALVEKSKPDWQKGKLNGIGGKIEVGETPRQAMVREFKEETGIETFESEWKLFLILFSDMWKVHFYTATRVKAERVIGTPDEPIMWINFRDLYQFNVINNLHWIIPLARDTDLKTPITIIDETLPGEGTTKA